MTAKTVSDFILTMSAADGERGAARALQAAWRAEREEGARLARMAGGGAGGLLGRGRRTGEAGAGRAPYDPYAAGEGEGEGEEETITLLPTTDSTDYGEEAGADYPGLGAGGAAEDPCPTLPHWVGTL